MTRLRFLPVLLAVAATALLPAPAQAAPAAPATVDVTVTTAGFTAPLSVAAGQVTLRVRSDDPAGAWIGLVRLQPGVALDDYVEHVRRAMSDDPATAVAGGRAVTRDAVMLGGAAAADVPVSATVEVAPGDHLLVDFRDAAEPDFADRIRTLRVEPGTGRSQVRGGARITATDAGFRAPATLVSGAPVVVTNASGQYTEAILMRLRPGMTLVDVDAFFAGAGAYPFDGLPTGIVPMSPGRTAVLQADLPAGNYALVTWVRNLDTGRMLAQDGMRDLVTVVSAG